MNCKCPEFADLNIDDRQNISTRAKLSRQIKASLTHVTTHADKEHKLFKCPKCGQLWQSSNAWNWGSKEYFFRVPKISTKNWLVKAFVDPDEILLFYGIFFRFLTALKPDETRDGKCNIPTCNSPPLKLSNQCLKHHVQSLQKIKMLPQKPKGRWFAPYEWFPPVLKSGREHGA